jgi:signal transduction histidine kinase
MTVSFRVKVLASHALVALLVGAVTLVIVDRLVARRLEQQVDHRLEAQARGVAAWSRRAQHPAQLARRLADVVAARVTILDGRGIAIGESDAEPGAPPAPDRDGAAGGRSAAEVTGARDRGVGHATRWSPVRGQPVRYVALATDDDRVIRLGLPIGEVDQVKRELRGQLLAAALVSFLIALGLAALVAGPLTRRLREATAVARRIGAGDYDVAAPRGGRDELGVLSHALATSAAELREAERRRRDFLADVAHELRTPVTSIRGYAQVLAAGAVPAAEAHEFVQTIQRNAIRIGTLVDELLELEALEAGRAPPLADDIVVLAPIVRGVIETTRVRAAEIGATVRTSVADDLRARGDADAVERVLLNLVDNALRHGGDGVTVELGAALADGRVRLDVADSGPGVPSEHRARIFERVHRGAAGADRERRGSGLGLAIGRELATAMHGTLSLTAASRFTLDLPAA